MMEFNEEEVKVLKAIIIEWLNEGFTIPPYDDEEYSVFEKLGITQEEAHQYDVSRGSARRVIKCLNG